MKRRRDENSNSELKRLLNFRNSTRYGPIFICSSCDQKMFQNGVLKLSEELEEIIQNKNIDVYNKALGENIKTLEIKTNNASDYSAYLCFTCKKHLIQGKIPPMSHANNLSLVPLNDDPF